MVFSFHTDYKVQAQDTTTCQAPNIRSRIKEQRNQIHSKLWMQSRRIPSHSNTLSFMLHCVNWSAMFRCMAYQLATPSCTPDKLSELMYIGQTVWIKASITQGSGIFQGQWLLQVSNRIGSCDITQRQNWQLCDIHYKRVVVDHTIQLQIFVAQKSWEFLEIHVKVNFRDRNYVIGINFTRLLRCEHSELSATLGHTQKYFLF